jgi:hypothetical protein
MDMLALRVNKMSKGALRRQCWADRLTKVNAPFILSRNDGGENR